MNTEIKLLPPPDLAELMQANWFDTLPQVVQEYGHACARAAVEADRAGRPAPSDGAIQGAGRVLPEDVPSTLVQDLRSAVEGECGGLDITETQARMILGFLLSRYGQPAATEGAFERDHRRAVRAIEISEVTEIQGLSPENAIDHLVYMLNQQPAASAEPVLHDIDAGIEVMGWLRENGAPYGIYDKMSACLFGDPDKKAPRTAGKTDAAPAAASAEPYDSEKRCRAYYDDKNSRPFVTEGMPYRQWQAVWMAAQYDHFAHSGAAPVAARPAVKTKPLTDDTMAAARLIIAEHRGTLAALSSERETSQKANEQVRHFGEMISVGGDAPAVPRWLLDAAQRIEKYMADQGCDEWAIGGIQKRSAQAQPVVCQSTDDWRSEVDTIANNIGEALSAAPTQEIVDAINPYVDQLFALAQQGKMNG